MFFTSQTGQPITGDEHASFASQFPSLPDNTQCNAMITSFKLNEYQGEESYQIIYQIVDGDFKGLRVKQRIDPFNSDATKAQRNLNMMFRIFKLCNLPTDCQKPGNEFLAPAQGTIVAIKIGNGIIQGESRTWVREVWPQGELDTMTGQTPVKTQEPKKQLDSAFARNPAPVAPLDDSDIPF